MQGNLGFPDRVSVEGKSQTKLKTDSLHALTRENADGWGVTVINHLLRRSRFSEAFPGVAHTYMHKQYILYIYKHIRCG